MAWVTPQTWVVGQLVGADELNEQLRDNLVHLKLALDDDGKIPALTSTYLADVDGSSLTGIAKTAADTDHTAGVNDFSAGAGTRIVLPVGPDKWAI